MYGLESVREEAQGYVSLRVSWIRPFTLKSWIIPFIQSVYPDGHRLMANNDPKHTSKAANDFFTNNGVYW